MFSKINSKLVEIQEKLRKKEKYQFQLEDFQKELDTLEEKIHELRGRFEAERKDVQKLERIGLTNLIATLSGKKEEKLSKETQKMIAAQFQVEEAEKTKLEIETSILELQNKLLPLETVETEYQQLLLLKQEAIITSPSPFAAKVLGLSEKEGVIKAYLVELNEAIAAGERAEDALRDARNSLKSAQSWGTFDMLGGGTITGLIKHQHIDDAKTKLNMAQTTMRKFQKELLDVQEQANIQVDISGMLKFADFFFDSFLVDYFVQGKIHDSLEKTKTHYTKVCNIVHKLKGQLSEKTIQLQKITKEKQEMIESL